MFEKPTDLVPYWVNVCRLLDVDPSSIPMPQVVWTPHEGPAYLNVTNTFYLPKDKQVMLGQLSHELAHAVMCQSPGFSSDHNYQEERAQWIETQVVGNYGEDNQVIGALENKKGGSLIGNILSGLGSLFGKPSG